MMGTYTMGKELLHGPRAPRRRRMAGPRRGLNNRLNTGLRRSPSRTRSPVLSSSPAGRIVRYGLFADYNDSIVDTSQRPSLEKMNTTLDHLEHTRALVSLKHAEEFQ
jgi:hypothetical protein